MTSVRFDLEPHQWPPHARGEREGFADAAFTVEWDEKKVEVAARWVWMDKDSAILFFRALTQKTVYVVSCWMRLRFTPSFYYALNDDQRFTLIKDHVQNALKGYGAHSYGHLMPRPLSQSEVAPWLFVTHDKTFGAWSDDELVGLLTSFRLDSKANLTSDTINDPDSPAGFALCWSQLSHAEQCQRAVSFVNGNWKEFSEVVRAAVYFGVPSLANNQTWISFDHGFCISQGNSRFSMYDPGVRLRRWGLYIANYFAPHRNQTLASQHLCVAEQLLSPLLQFELPQPSQHERLEAALLLRDWARGRIPPREARLLLPKL